MSILIDSVSKTYESRSKGGTSTVALSDANLSIRDGEFISLVGPSGCGKSTLLRVIQGLLDPSEGSVEVSGERVDGPTRNSAFVFQNAALLPWMSIRQNVLMSARFRKELGKNRETEERVDEVLAAVGLAEFADKYPHQLSGGMQQRANIARALVVDSKVLLMDEPFGALDAMTRQLMQEELLKFTESSKNQKTVVLVTHSLDEAALLSDRIVVMTRRPGRIKTVIDVPFERPRDASVRRDPRYQELCDSMWDLIQEEVKDAL